MKTILHCLAFAMLFASCTQGIASSQVWLTSAAGDKCAEKEAVVFQQGTAQNAIVIDINQKKQTIDGYGG